MTEMKAFAEQIAGTMNMEENGSKKFRIWEKRKINGTVSFGIFSAGNGGGAFPVVYLEPFYDAYRNGMPLEEITGQIRKGLDGGESPDPEAVRILERFETAAGRLVFRLVNADMNRELLDQVPHVRILDLAVVFYVWLGKGNGGVLTAMVTREAADRWGVTPEGLWKLASVNAKREMPPVLRGIGTMLEETMAGEGRTLPGESQAGSSGEDFMYVLTNREGIWGAGCILYPGELKKAASRLGGDLVVLPSSVHETLLLVRTGEEDPEELGRMISGINREVVAREEWLSFQAYGYSRKEDRLMLLSEMPPAGQPEGGRGWSCADLVQA